MSEPETPDNFPSPAHAESVDGLPEFAPDHAEQLGDLDNIVPTRGYEMTPMVGLGGSAGSLPALQKFLQVAPADAGIVYVVIVHLSPTHESSLPELLSLHTSMPVSRVTDGTKVEPNNVYVITPGKHVSTVD